MGFFCFVSVRGCELSVIPCGGMWIPAGGARPGGGGCFGLLRFLSVWLDLHSGSFVWELVQGRLRCQIKELTADGLLPRISCRLPMFGVRSRIWKGEDGGWMNRCAVRQAGEQRTMQLARSEEEEEQLGSLCNFSVTQGSFCKKGCTVLLFNI